MDKALEYKAKITKRLEGYPKLVELEAQTGVDKFYIFVVLALVVGILLFVVGGVQLVVGLVGFVYPAYQSFKALSTPGEGDDTQWLTYWVVYAFFKLTEEITDLILSWVPLYFFLKIGFLVWCYHPSTVGSNVIYQKLLKPYVSPQVAKLDGAIHGTGKSE